MNSVDVPSPIDLRLTQDALEWERKAMDRPFRQEFFQAITSQLLLLGKRNLKLIELGSGPGFLAHHVLARLPQATLTLLDFSPAMHRLARDRLSEFAARTSYVQRDFKQPGWTAGLETYDAVLTVQAIHELRHKCHAATFHRNARRLLREQGVYLACDHYYAEGGMQNDQLFMRLDEQRSSFRAAGFRTEEILVKGGRSLYLAF